jgi:hypothetical protein
MAGMGAKAHENDLATAPVKVGVAASGTTGTGVTYGVADQLQQASTQIAPLSDTIQIVKYIVLAIGISIAALTLYGIYRDWKAQKARNGEDTVEVPAEESFA